jgi:hypothetical protein
MTTNNPNSKPCNKKNTPYKRPKSREGKTQHSSKMNRLNKALNDQTKPSHYGGWSMTKNNPNSKPCNKKPHTRNQNPEGKEKIMQRQVDRPNKARKDQAHKPFA